jgi:hypothetical protein
MRSPLHGAFRFDRNERWANGIGARMKHLKIIGAVTIVVGIALEVLRIGSQFSLGTLIAGVGIVAIVYAVLAAREKRRGI